MAGGLAPVAAVRAWIRGRVEMMLPGDTLAWLCSRGPLNVLKAGLAVGKCAPGRSCMDLNMRLP